MESRGFGDIGPISSATLQDFTSLAIIVLAGLSLYKFLTGQR